MEQISRRMSGARMAPPRGVGNGDRQGSGARLAPLHTGRSDASHARSVTAEAGHPNRVGVVATESANSVVMQAALRRSIKLHSPVRALLILNVQRDFFEGGAMPLPDAARILPIIARLRRTKRFDMVILSRMGRLEQHCGFCSNHPGAQLHEKVTSHDGSALHMWPNVCLLGSEGAEFHPDLAVLPTDVQLTTGLKPHVESQSAFVAHSRSNVAATVAPESELRTLLQDHGITDLFICGLATDFAVQETALDARALPTDIAVYVVEDACDGVNEEACKEALRTMAVERVHVVASVGPQIASIPNNKPPPPPSKPPRPGAAVLPGAVAPQGRAEDVTTRAAAGAGVGAGAGAGPTGSASQRHESRPSARASNRLFSLRASEGRPNSLHSRASSHDASESVTLVQAAWYGRDKELAAAIQRLDRPDVVNTLTPTTGQSALHVACDRGHLACVKLLVEAGASANLRNRTGATPLLMAAMSGHCHIGEYLLAATDAHPNVVEDQLGLSPLMVAAARGDASFVRLLVIGSPHRSLRRALMVETVTKLGSTAVSLACAAMRRSATEHEWEFGVVRSSAVAELDTKEEARSTQPTQLDVGADNDVSEEALEQSRHKSNLRLLRDAADVVTMLLETLPDSRRRLLALRRQNADGWAPIHFAAKSGVLAMIDWSLLGDHMVNLPVNLPTSAGHTMLHLAAWNGRAASIALLLGAWPDSRQQRTSNPWRGRAHVNLPVRGRRHTELDLALMRGFVDCARLLLRAGCIAKVYRGDKMDEFLHRLILLGDGVGAELLMRSNNGVQVHPVIIDIVHRMKYPDSCTFTFATYHKPVSQHMYECIACEERVCVTCASKCHPAHQWSHSNTHKHQLEYIGFQRETYCGCLKSTCQALAVVDQREVEGYRYVPRPLDTSAVEVDLSTDSELGAAVNKLAKNSHEVWAAERVDQGWTYGPSRDDARRLHPLLVPWSRLDAEAKQYDLQSATEAVKVALALGYHIVQTGDAPAAADGAAAARETDEEEDGVHMGDGSTYVPKPINTHGVDLGPELLALVELLARNVHEVWAAGKLAAKWKYMPERALADMPPGSSVSAKTSSMLVPYEFLTEKEKASSRSSAMEMVRTLLQLGFDFRREEGVEAVDPASLSNQMSELALQAMRLRIDQLNDFKLGVFNACLFWAARNGQSATIPLVMGVDVPSHGKNRRIQAQINCTDEMRRTPLYLAVQNQQKDTVKLLLDFGADMEVADLNGTTALSAAAFLGYVEIADMLVEHGALYMARDRIGMTPLHYAVYGGHLKVVELLAKKLSVRGKPGVDFEFESRHRFASLLVSTGRQLARYALGSNASDGSPAARDKRHSQTLEQLVRSHASSAAKLSPMTVAVHARQFKAAKLLLAFGANPLHKDDSGVCPHDRALFDHAEAEDLAANLNETRSHEIDASTLKAFANVSRYADTHSTATENKGRAWDMAKTAFQLDRLKSHQKQGSKAGSFKTSSSRRDMNRARAREMERAIALAEHAREQAINKSQAEARAAARMVRVLSGCKEVQHERMAFAWKALVRQMIAFVVLMAVFGIMTPTAHDYGSKNLADFHGSLWATMDDSFQFVNDPISTQSGDYGVTPQKWWQWVDHNILWLPRPASGATLASSPYTSAQLANRPVDSLNALIEPPESAAAGPALVNTNNVVVGALRLRHQTPTATSCDVPEEIMNLPAVTCYTYDKFDPVLEDGGNLEILLSSGNVTERRLALAPYRPSDEFVYSGRGSAQGQQLLFAVHTQWLTLDLAVYNPMLNAFAPVRLEARSSPTGAMLSIIDVQGSILFNGRFQPSVTFQLVLVLVILVQAVLMWRDAARTGVRRWTGNGWNIYEVITWIGFLIILAMDVETKRRVDNLALDLAETGTFVDVWSVVNFFSVERDLLAIVLLLLVVRFIKYLRLTPDWGPMVVAIIMTWRHPSVLLYLGVSIVLTFAFAISFHVAFGSQAPQFASLLSSFVSLFNMGFANDWSQLSQISQKTLVLAFFFFYVIFAIVLLNLFIGIVTDVYPKAREKSTAQWEASITTLMEADIKRRRKNLLQPGLATRIRNFIKNPRMPRRCRCCRKSEKAPVSATYGLPKRPQRQSNASASGNQRRVAPDTDPTPRTPVKKLQAAAAQHGSTRDVLSAREQNPDHSSSNLRRVLLSNLTNAKMVDLDKINRGSPQAHVFDGPATPTTTIASVDQAQAERFVEASAAVVPHRVSLSMASTNDDGSDGASAWHSAQARFTANMARVAGPAPRTHGRGTTPHARSKAVDASADDGAAPVVAADFKKGRPPPLVGVGESKDGLSGLGRDVDTPDEFDSPANLAVPAKNAAEASAKDLHSLSRLNQVAEASEVTHPSKPVQELESRRLKLEQSVRHAHHDSVRSDGDEDDIHPLLAAHQLGDLTLTALKKVANAMRLDVHWGARTYLDSHSKPPRRDEKVDALMATESSDDEDNDDIGSGAPGNPVVPVSHKTDQQLHHFMHVMRHRIDAQDESVKNIDENLTKLMATVKALATSVLGDSDGNSTPGAPTPHGGMTKPRPPTSGARRGRRSSYVRGQPQPYRPMRRGQSQRKGMGIRQHDSFSLGSARSSVASGLTVGTAPPAAGSQRSPFARGRAGLALPSLVAGNPNSNGSMRITRRRSRASVASDDDA